MVIAKVFGEENTALAVQHYKRRREDLTSCEHFLLHYHGMTMAQYEEWLLTQ